MEFSTYIDTVLIIVGVCGFFWVLKAAVERNTESIRDLQHTLAKSAELHSKEHGDLLSALKEGQAIMRKAAEATADEHKDMIKAMADDHKEMIRIIGDISQTAAKIDAKIDAHMAEDRAK